MKSILTAALLLSASLLYADVPALINYQGLLTDINGNVVSGSKTVSISIHDAATNGTQLYSESIGSVTVQNGIYSFQFGSGPTFTTTLATGSQHWLQVTLDGVPQTPRERLVSVPFAMRAGVADSVKSTQQQILITSADSLLAYGSSIGPPPYYFPIGSSSQTRHVRVAIPANVKVLKSVQIRATNNRPNFQPPLSSTYLRVIRRTSHGVETNALPETSSSASGSFDLICQGDVTLDKSQYQYFVEIYIPESNGGSVAEAVLITFE